MVYNEFRFLYLNFKLNCWVMFNYSDDLVGKVVGMKLDYFGGFFGK